MIMARATKSYRQSGKGSDLVLVCTQCSSNVGGRLSFPLTDARYCACIDAESLPMHDETEERNGETLSPGTRHGDCADRRVTFTILFR